MITPAYSQDVRTLTVPRMRKKPTVRWRRIDAPDPNYGPHVTRSEWRGTWIAGNSWETVLFTEASAPKTPDIEGHALRSIARLLDRAA